MDTIEHIENCKQLMMDAAARADLFIKLNKYDNVNTCLTGIEIQLRDKDNYLIYRSHNSVLSILSFIDGYLYNK